MNIFLQENKKNDLDSRISDFDRSRIDLIYFIKKLGNFYEIVLWNQPIILIMKYLMNMKRKKKREQFINIRLTYKSFMNIFL